MSKFLGDVLKLDSDNKIDILDNKQYRISGVQNYGQGIVIRREVSGKELTMKKYQIIKNNQLMWCKVDTKSGAFGLTKNEHVGSLASTNMALANIDTEQIIPDFLEMLFQNKHFHEHITKYSSGSTNRKYLTPKQLFDLIEIPDLTIDEQKKFLNKVNNLKNSGLSDEIDTQQSLLKQLKQTILQEAIEGKLTVKWRAENPTISTAKELLEQIKTEKEKLVKDKKIKASKPLAPINEDEISFDIPQSWEWCRLGEIVEIKGGKRLPAGYKLLKTETPYVYLRVSDMQNNTIDESDLHYLDEKVQPLIKQYIIKKEDIYMVIVGGTIGKCGLIPEKFDGMNLTENAARLILHLIEKHFLLFMLNSPFCQTQFIDKTKQVGVQKMALNRFSNTLIPLPPLEEQKEIISTIEKLFTICDELEAEINQNKTTVDNLMATVLKEAFEN